MRLYLLRHAEAADTYPDPTRSLTAKGRRDSEALGDLLERQGIALPSRVWCSPYRRAGETAALVLKHAVSEASPEIRDGLTPCDDPSALLPALRELREDLLIVGHNPHLSTLATLLLSGRSHPALVLLRKCTLLRLDLGPQPTLAWMLTPKLFRP